jgi:hypothetical protein
MPKTLQVTRSQLGLASLDFSAVNLDWCAAKESDWDAWEMILPVPTFGDIADHAPELLTQRQLATHANRYDVSVPEALADAFRDVDAFRDWESGFEPLMSYVWPVYLPNDVGSQDVADRLAQFAPPMTLIYFGRNSDYCPEKYGFALSGGGMNLADEIASAYLCARQVPPRSILEGLSGVINERKLAKIGRPLRVAYRMAEQALHRSARGMAYESVKIFSHRKH